MGWFEVQMSKIMINCTWIRSDAFPVPGSFKRDDASGYPGEVGLCSQGTWGSTWGCCGNPAAVSNYWDSYETL